MQRFLPGLVKRGVKAIGSRIIEWFVLRLKNWTHLGPFIREGSAGPTPLPQTLPGSDNPGPNECVRSCIRLPANAGVHPLKV